MALLMNCSQLAKEIDRIDSQREALELSPLFTDTEKWIVSFFYIENKKRLRQLYETVLQRNILEIEVVAPELI
jgi:hypothetical protein